MKEFFVEQIFSGVLVTAFPFAFIAGIISFLSPCVLPLVPGYLSFAAGFSVSRGKVLLGSVLFVLGFSSVFISYGAIFGGLGNALSSNEEVISRILGVVTIFLGLAVGSKLSAEAFLQVKTLGILALGAVAFAIGTASGVMMAKLMNRFSDTPINPLIGAAGVSAVPMAARVANKIGLESNPHNFLLMHAMGPNVAGVIGSAVAAGVLLSLIK